MKHPATFVGAVALALIVAGCSTVTETGRKQVLPLNSAEEMKLGMTEFDKLKTSTPI